MKKITFFNTRKLAREFALNLGLKTTAVQDNGKDKEIGKRWFVYVKKQVNYTKRVAGLGIQKIGKWFDNRTKTVDVTIKRNITVNLG